MPYKELAQRFANPFHVKFYLLKIHSSVCEYPWQPTHIFTNKVTELNSLNSQEKFMKDIFPPVLAKTAQ
jgi:hypothetical protein